MYLQVLLATCISLSASEATHPQQEVIGCGTISQQEIVAVDKGSKLEFSQDDKDLVVKTTITVNGSAHVLWNDVSVFAETVTLRYHVFQCIDLSVRSQKQVEITWRIPNVKREGMTFEAKDDFQPTTGQLKALLPQLEKLAAEGDKHRRSTRLEN
jgi:hypothetical protein